MDNIQNLIKKAEAGDAEAQFNLATAYFSGNSVKDYAIQSLHKFFLPHFLQNEPIVEAKIQTLINHIGMDSRGLTLHSKVYCRNRQ